MFDKDSFMQYMQENFEGFENSMFRETVENIIDYGLDNMNHSKGQLVTFIWQIIPQVEIEEVAMFADDSILTKSGIKAKQEKIRKLTEGR